MIRTITILSGLLLAFDSAAANLARGQEINKSCALCHGLYGQGASGQLSPRLAGLSREYLVKSLKDYRSGERKNFSMIRTSAVDRMSDADIEDVSAYLASIDLNGDPRFVVPLLWGDIKAGEELYASECDSCHKQDGSGKPEKEIPGVIGQHAEYLFQSMKMFQAGYRIHDNEPDDQELFQEFSDKTLYDLTGYMTTFDNSDTPRMAELPKPMKLERREVASIGKGGSLEISDITQTVARMALDPGVTREDAIDAMLSKAIELNMKLVGRQDVSKEIEARGEKMPYLTIFQFCNPMDARAMVIHNPIYASYMPCRIALVEDGDGRDWLMMLNLDMLIDSQLLAPELAQTAIKVNQSMIDIMVAGSTGEF